MAKKWLDTYKGGGEYPQVGPRDWMNEHGWYARDGGPYDQGRDFDPIANSNNPQYQDYGSMYSTDPRFGLFYKPQSTENWGMGNAANLMKTNYAGFSGSPAIQQNLPAPVQGVPRQQSTNSHTNEDTDYSIDSVRMKEGGSTKKQNAPIYVDNPKDPRLQAYNDSLAWYNKGEDVANNTSKTGVFQLDNTKDKIKGLYDHISYQDYINNWGGYKGEFSHYNSGTDNRMYPESIDVYSKSGLDFTKDFGARYTEPQQPVIYQGKDNNGVVPKQVPNGIKRILAKQDGYKKLPVLRPNQLPIQSSNQQQGYEMSLPDFREDEYHTPYVENGKLVEPAGIYKKGSKQYQQGGTVMKGWLNNFK